MDHAFLGAQRATLQEMLGQVQEDRPRKETDEAILQALERMDDGEYLNCQERTSSDCRQEIPRGLLERHPTVDACLDCRLPEVEPPRAFAVQSVGPVCGSGLGT